MSSTIRDIASISNRSKQLHQQLDSLQHAPPQLQQLIFQLGHLEKELDQNAIDIEIAQRVTKNVRADHERYRDSKVSKFASRVTGQGDAFTSKGLAEEKEYYDALQKLKATEDRGARLRTEISENQKAKLDRQEETDRFNASQGELDVLYEHAFKDVAVGARFPEIVEAKHDAKAAKAAHQETKLTLRSNGLVVAKLKQAQYLLEKATRNVASLRSYNLGGDRIYADDLFFETKKVSMVLGRVQTLLEQAEILNVEFALPSFMRIPWDDLVLFKDKYDKELLARCKEVIDKEWGRAGERAETAKRDNETAYDRYVETKQELQDIRRASVDKAVRMVDNGEAEDEPPAYG